MDLFEGYWNNRYLSGETGWDIGEVATPLKAYFDQLDNKELRILIPGAGNAYEAEYLYETGFKNVTVIDIAEIPLEKFGQRVPGFPKEQLMHNDFFSHEGQYDLIIEQTFFCALDPSLRKNYVAKMLELLKPNGLLVGLLFNIPLNKDRPPFGGELSEYRSLFEPYFDVLIMETAYNSIPPRAGNELFMMLSKPQMV